MPQRTAYSQGTPNWVDLRTTDPAAAKSFYGGLFGWEFTDLDEHYSMALKDGAVVAAIAPDDAVKWTTYFAVPDADAAAATIEAAGGKVLTGPLDVADAGRTAFAEDPNGVTFAVWQAKSHIGASLVNEPGTFIWSELMTEGIDAALAFYEEVLGLTKNVVDLGGSPFVGLNAGETMIGGVHAPTVEGAVSRWIVYFSVADVDATVAQAKELGATTVHGPVDTPVGPLAALRDPQGGSFSVWAYNGPVS
ncbi:hypothetical protein SAMN05421504_104281 [Amycolatopsis xylanica]|uniref:VOC domain-containing protein n=1 Tax=Amycolatopsis xylanica TaxID=589385 RepID=A0A1H3GLX6_9PSEU|nr:VOC family protein [Amycolatopsis xylanica]SDY03289.1 hypothetical protein SAMN05421504_104281 [Amycolatopsis xylanica]